MASGRRLRALPGHDGYASGVAFGPDGSRLASGGADGVVRVWDLGTGAEALAFRGHRGAVFGVAFGPDGRRVASAGRDGTVRTWELADGAGRVLGSHGEAARCVAFSPDGARLASGGADRMVRVWDAAGGREVLAFQITVLERPSLDSVEIKGNKDIKTEDLQKSLRNVGLRPARPSTARRWKK